MLEMPWEGRESLTPQRVGLQWAKANFQCHELVNSIEFLKVLWDFLGNM